MATQVSGFDEDESGVVVSEVEQKRLGLAWDGAATAPEYLPLPDDIYDAETVEGTLVRAKQRGTPGYRVLFRILSGAFAGRRVSQTWWLTDAAMPMAKRDLGKLGIQKLDQLRQPLPAKLPCRLHIEQQPDDDGRNRPTVVRLEVRSAA